MHKTLKGISYGVEITNERRINIRGFSWSSEGDE